VLSTNTEKLREYSSKLDFFLDMSVGITHELVTLEHVPNEKWWFGTSIQGQLSQNIISIDL
jgi:hypothetical protein